MFMSSSCGETSRPAPHAAQTRLILGFPIPRGLDGLLSEVSGLAASVRVVWGRRRLLTAPSAAAACAWWPAELLAQHQHPLGEGPVGPSRHSPAYFWLGVSQGHFCPTAPTLCNACEESFVLRSFPFLPASPSTDLCNVQHLDMLIWL